MTQQSFFEGIKYRPEGYRLSDISAAVQAYVEGHGFSVVREYVGHGIGTRCTAPEVPNYGNPGHGPRLLRGMTIAVEPMVNAGTPPSARCRTAGPSKTADGKYAAHYENTILITAGEPEILTAPEKSLDVIWTLQIKILFISLPAGIREPFFVLAVEGDFLLLADGKGRKAGAPKRKRRKHVALHRERLRGAARG